VSTCASTVVSTRPLSQVYQGLAKTVGSIDFLVIYLDQEQWTSRGDILSTVRKNQVENTKYKQNLVACIINTL
jgi:hypothetical protein